MTQSNTKPFAITLDVGSSLANRTGSWRTLKPVYVSRTPPCNAKCPAGEKCQAWLFLAENGDYEALEKDHGRKSASGMHGARVLSHV